MGEITSALTQCLSKTGNSGLPLVSLNQDKSGLPCQFDLIVADTPPTYAPSFQTRVLVCAAGCAIETTGHFPHATVITYGAGAKDSVSLSACSDHGELVCFQRVITPIMGDAPGLGEVSVPIFGGNPNTGLAIAAVFRYLGLV